MADEDDLATVRSVLENELRSALAAIKAKDLDGAAALLEQAQRKLRAIADGHKGSYPNASADG